MSSSGNRWHPPTVQFEESLILKVNDTENIHIIKESLLSIHTLFANVSLGIGQPTWDSTEGRGRAGGLPPSPPI